MALKVDMLMKLGSLKQRCGNYIEGKIIVQLFFTSKDQLVDILINAVGFEEFENALSKWGVADPMTQIEGSVKNNVDICKYS